MKTIRIKQVLLMGATVFFLSACGGSKDMTGDEEELAEDTVQTPSEDELAEEERKRAEPDDDFTKDRSPHDVKAEAAEKHSEIDYTRPDFHPSEEGEVESLMLGDEEGQRHGPFEILYNNGFSEKGTYEHGKRKGEWKMYNRNNELIRIDVYENGDNVDYRIIKERK